MAYRDKYLTSIYGRRLGIRRLEAVFTGGAQPVELIVGPEDVQQGIITESTGVNCVAFGISILAGTSAGSSSVYVLEPPIPGVRKSLFWNGTNVAYVKTLNSETFQSTQGSSFTVLKSSGIAYLELMGITTAIWAGELSSGSSSQASAIAQTTTT